MGRGTRPGRIIFRVHAIQRMFERSIMEEDVRAVLADGETLRIIRLTRRIPAACCWAGAAYARCTL